MPKTELEDFDIIVAGAGLGGIYALHYFSQRGLKVIGLEQSDQIGGVWNLNRYPGARVDVDSIIYSYSFSEELLREWSWNERYATWDELLRYLNHVADKLDVRGMIRFNAGVTGAQWRPDEQRYYVQSADGIERTCRFLAMATGNLTEPRDPGFPGLEDFKGEVLKTSRWPSRPVDLANRRVGILGTGSSGVQAIPVIAEQASHLYVFQRTAHYAVPAYNWPFDEGYRIIADDPLEARAKILANLEDLALGPPLNPTLGPSRPVADYTPAEQLERLELVWADGGQNMLFVFGDQFVNEEAAEVVSDFVRDKIRHVVKDQVVAEKLCPKYLLGPKRIANSIGYYETFNRDNVTLVDIAEEPVEKVTATGIQTRRAHYELDAIVLALGFKAFSGAIDNANIRNEFGDSPTSYWGRGPQTMLGLMTVGFPNLFMMTGPGSPSVLGNLFGLNEFHTEWIYNCIKFMDANGYSSIEPTEQGQASWTAHVTELGANSLRCKLDNYMVHINPDGTRAFIPYHGSMGAYYREANEIAEKNYEGFRFHRPPGYGLDHAPARRLQP